MDSNTRRRERLYGAGPASTAAAAAVPCVRRWWYPVAVHAIAEQPETVYGPATEQAVAVGVVAAEYPIEQATDTAKPGIVSVFSAKV